MTCLNCSRPTRTHCGTYDCPQPRLELKFAPERRFNPATFVMAVLLALILAAIIWAGTAYAQPGPQQCPPRERIIAMLAEQFGEVRISTGIQFQGQTPTAALEVWANDETGTWTIFLSRPDGTACMVADGRDWNSDPTQPEFPRGTPS